MAKNYPLKANNTFVDDVEKLDERAFAREALEQHLLTSHVVYQKARLLIWAGTLFAVSVVLVVLALILR